MWPHKDYPLIDVGMMELNRNPENFFAEVEQSAFNPANIVPGIGFSPDKTLQGRSFSYGDAQRYRLGVNHHLIPVNAARCPVHSYHRDVELSRSAAHRLDPRTLLQVEDVVLADAQRITLGNLHQGFHDGPDVEAVDPR